MQSGPRRYRADAGRVHAYDLVFCDSCIGGSSVASRLAEHNSRLHALYVADYAVHPLGTKSRRYIGCAIDRWIELSAACADSLLIACNTASIRLHERPEVLCSASRGGLRLVSMVDLLDRSLFAAKSRLRDARVCLMGTEFTVRQGLYRERLCSAGVSEVVPLAATRTESVIAHLHHTSNEGKQAILAEIGATIRRCDSVLLGCTCFPLITELIHELNPSCEIINPADSISDFVGSGASREPNRLTIAVSGGETMADHVRTRAAQFFPGWRVDNVLLWQHGCTPA